MAPSPFLQKWPAIKVTFPDRQKTAVRMRVKIYKYIRAICSCHSFVKSYESNSLFGRSFAKSDERFAHGCSFVKIDVSNSLMVALF